VGAVGSIVVEHAVGLVWRRELWGANIRFVNFDVLEELQKSVREAVGDDEETTNGFKRVSSWLSMSRQGVGVVYHSSVPWDYPTIVTGEVVLVEMG